MGQHTVSVLKLVPSIRIFAWATGTSPTGTSLYPINRKQESIWEAEQYHLYIIGVSSTKCHGSNTVELNEGWKLFYSGVNVTMSAQAGVGIFVSTHLTHCVTDWIPLGERVCLLKLRLQKQSLCVLQVYPPNAKAQYQPFLDEIGVALQKVIFAESIVLLGDDKDMEGCYLKTRRP